MIRYHVLRMVPGHLLCTFAWSHGYSVTDNMITNRTNQIQLLIITIPGLVLYLFFFVSPTLMGLVYSFFDWNGISRQMNFIGIENYIRLFTDRRFIGALSFTIYYTLLLVTITIVVAIFHALLLTSDVRGQNILRTVFFFPAVLSLITVGLIWNEIFFRAIPTIGRFFNINFLSHNILSNSASAKYGILFVNLWQWVSLPTILFIASLQSIPKELYESARIDGANSVQIFFRITLPFLIPMITLVLILTMRNGLTTFDYVKAMTDGGPGGSTETVGLLVYNRAFLEFEYSYAITQSTVLFLIVAIVSAIQLRLTSRGVEL